MSKDAKESFDPRFDPAFQPGFEGAATPVSAAPAAKPKDKRDLSPAQAALEKRSEQAEVRVTVEDADEEQSTSRRPNPFLIALAAISVTLIAGGFGAVQSVRGIFTSENYSVNIDYISLDMIKFGAPLAIALGVATAIGVIFLYAVEWNKKHQ